MKTLMPALAKLRERAADGGAASLSAALMKGAAPLVGVAALVTALVLVYAWNDQAAYKPVFGARQVVSATDMMAVLDSEKIQYRIHPESGQVLVPDSQLGKVRMVLAAKGVVAKLPVGLEIMDKSDPLGVSQFVQDIRFRRGLEGELVKSITALEPVEAARVHLSIAKSSSFVVGDGEKSSAAVMLTLKPGRTLGQEQVAAVINLVSGTVASLDPQRVSVVDQAGRLLSARVDLSDGFDGNARSEAAKQYQDEVRRNVRDLLTPIMGEDNFRLSVTAEVDVDRVQETHEKYGTAPKVTNEALREEVDHAAAAVGIPGSLSNRPVTAAAPSSSASAPEAGDKKSATTRNYAYDRSITQIKRSRGRLARISVAVAINSSVAPAGKKQWEQADLDKVKELLHSGLGIDAERGDKLNLSTLPFPPRPQEAPWYEQRHNIEDMVIAFAYVLATILGFFLIVRPLLRAALSLLGRGNAAPASRGASEATAPSSNGGQAGAGGEEKRAGSAMDVLVNGYELPPTGSSVDTMLVHLRGLAEKEPGRVAEVITQWVQNNERSNERN